MNIYAIVVLVALLLHWALDCIADVLNLKALKSDLPHELADVYEEETYRRSQAYTRVRTRFGLVASTASLIVLLAFWFSGGFNWLDELVRSWGFGSIATGLLYIGLLGLGASLLRLPFSIYSTFVIEERFGFNRTTPRTFVMDQLKGLTLSVAIGAPLLAGVIAFFEYFGTYGWLYAWVGVTVFTLIVQYVAPAWILPLFNRFEPLADEALLEKIERYAESVRFRVRDVFVMDGSKRSTKSNAFFIGFGARKRIVLFDTLIEKHDRDELLAVLAHEIGHYKKKHILQRTVLSVVHTGILLWLLSIFLKADGLFAAFYVEQPSIHAGLVFFSLLYMPVEMVLSPMLLHLSRKHEYEADEFAARTTGDPGSLIDALKKLSGDNLSNLTPHRLYTLLHYSHPPVLQRIRALEDRR